MIIFTMRFTVQTMEQKEYNSLIGDDAAEQYELSSTMRKFVPKDNCR